MTIEWERDGVAIIPRAISCEQARSLAAEVSSVSSAMPARGIRNAELRFAGVKSLACQPSILALARQYLQSCPTLVRAICFDKVQGANWSVPWHQDRTIAVAHRVACKGWGPWSIKDGVHHVQPPLEVLNQMVTLRIHLDAADERNGCLRVVPGSYRLGIIDSCKVAVERRQGEVVACVVAEGGAVAMRPHTLHASSKSQCPGHRRVVHLEYAGCELPAGMAWC